MCQHQISIVIITQKEILSQYEKISFQRAIEVFSSFNKYLIIPETINSPDWIDKDSLTIIKLDPSNFINVKTYSLLLLSDSFYQKFTDSKFILIYQLDCFAFHNNFESFLQFDYVGAPWFESQNHLSLAMIKTILFRKPFLAIQSILHYWMERKKDGVGNGGFSLRRVEKFIEITTDPTIKKLIAVWSKQTRPYEDLFYSFIVPLFFEKFKIADIQTALTFSFEMYPQKCFKLNHNELPLGCHAWTKHDITFWRAIFDSYGYKI